jgi:hypothetical protein
MVVQEKFLTPEVSSYDVYFPEKLMAMGLSVPG